MLTHGLIGYTQNIKKKIQDQDQEHKTLWQASLNQPCGQIKKLNRLGNRTGNRFTDIYLTIFLYVCANAHNPKLK